MLEPVSDERIKNVSVNSEELFVEKVEFSEISYNVQILSNAQFGGGFLTPLME